jgi:hypothetical protein
LSEGLAFVEEADSLDTSLGDDCDAAKPADPEGEVMEGDWSQPGDPFNMRTAKQARGSNFELIVTCTV